MESRTRNSSKLKNSPSHRKVKGSHFRKGKVFFFYGEYGVWPNISVTGLFCADFVFNRRFNDSSFWNEQKYYFQDKKKFQRWRSLKEKGEIAASFY